MRVSVRQGTAVVSWALLCTTITMLAVGVMLVTEMITTDHLLVAAVLFCMTILFTALLTQRRREIVHPDPTTARWRPAAEDGVTLVIVLGIGMAVSLSVFTLWTALLGGAMLILGNAYISMIRLADAGH